jgi:hypothetical protein
LLPSGFSIANVKRSSAKGSSGKRRVSDRRLGPSIALSLKACHLKGCQRVVRLPLTPPGSGEGSVASCSTRASTSERCDGESLTNAFHSLKPCTVSLEGNPSVALTSEADVRFFIPRLYSGNFKTAKTNRSCAPESMPRNIHAGKAVSG